MKGWGDRTPGTETEDRVKKSAVEKTTAAQKRGRNGFSAGEFLQDLASAHGGFSGGNILLGGSESCGGVGVGFELAGSDDVGIVIVVRASVGA
jgi:hypothetical protein